MSDEIPLGVALDALYARSEGGTITIPFERMHDGDELWGLLHNAVRNACWDGPRYADFRSMSHTALAGWRVVWTNHTAARYITVKLTPPENNIANR